MTSANNYIPSGPFKLIESYSPKEFDILINNYILETKKSHGNRRAFYDIDFKVIEVHERQRPQDYIYTECTRLKYMAFIMLSFAGEEEENGDHVCDCHKNS